MKYKFHVDKKIVEAEIANSATFHSPTEIKVDKTRLEILIGEVKDEEVLSFFVDNKLHQVEIVRDEGGYPQGIYIDDEFFSAALLKIDRLFLYKEKPVSASKSGVVKSFIPGYIKKIFFHVQDRVEENDIVLIHEAMKMENEIRAPKSGVIKSLGVHEGDNILANHLLFEIE
ncbi:MAG TPA: acetyl-CoA carboxylase biotin carboxyl carrier protein subunit [Patescibacteria group bacterium]|nr:acetyl-CoA carboxylase biotin carboxyl carrier protein subunit [Patescibacteria group bacterium]